MYNKLKNLIVGFFISFIGSIPLGYLNVVGVQFYEKDNLDGTIKYLLGIVIIETIVIFLTLKWASKLVFHTKWKNAITIFNIAFLLALAYVFHNYQPNPMKNTPQSFKYLQHYPLLMGIILSSLNFSQFPFWFSWNLYLTNQNYIQNTPKKLPFYLIGAATGTFAGMLTLIVSIHETISYTQFSFQNYIPVFFLGLAVWQGLVFLKNSMEKV